jgi:tryptophan synthase beta subunit
MNKDKEFPEFSHSYKDRELVDYVKDLFEQYANKEIEEKMLEDLIQEVMAEYGRRNHLHMKRTIH